MPTYVTKIEPKFALYRLLENDNIQQKPPATNKSDFIVPDKYVRSPKNNTIISTSNRHQKLSKNDDIENEINTGDCVKPTKAAESNKTGKRNNYDARKKFNKSSDPPP